ncbi:zinc finger protein 473-like [Gouania willdenowi]|uniref:Zinc finger protein 473-like n=1 Tax=Gouania willdenowi TaxID=441366 RepID=A0A8C5G165_GOUWI|nr:zinc finger protein 473-like [Gouania willdenowi]
MDTIKIEEVIIGGEIRAMPVEEISKPKEEMSQHAISPVPPYGGQNESMQCLECLITFSSSKAKERHIRKHHKAEYTQQLQMDNFLFSCYKCDKSFTSPEELSQHQLIHRKEEKPFSCSKCNKRFLTLSERYQHRRQDCDKRKSVCKSVCMACGHLMFSSAGLRSHRLAVHSQHQAGDDDDDDGDDADYTFQCCKCLCGFQTEKDLRQHMLECAKDVYCKNSGCKAKRASQKGEDDCDSPKKQCTSGVLQIPCPEDDCELLFPSVAALRDHKREAHVPPPKKLHNSG